jgi:prepilin-type N-terminal cleavage/methylation domain-containing protein
MKRTAFTMIELIFVIVILGILASVAIPKLAGVQDDALEASERGAIASARTGIQSLRGKRTIRGDVQIVTNYVSPTNGRAFSITFVGPSATTVTDNAFSPLSFWQVTSVTIRKISCKNKEIK